MPAHGTTPDEVLELFTRAGGSWWLALASNRPSREDDIVALADVPAVEVPRDATAWADADLDQVSHATGVTMPAATADTSAAAWVLFDDEALTVPRVSRWFSQDRTIVTGQEVFLSPDVLTIEFSPPQA